MPNSLVRISAAGGPALPAALFVLAAPAAPGTAPVGGSPDVSDFEAAPRAPERDLGWGR